MTRQEELIKAVVTALERPSSLPNEVLSLQGMSGNAFRGFINALLANESIETYLEIGVYNGSTAISALYGNLNKIRYWLIDNWSEVFVAFGKDPRLNFFCNFERILECEPVILEGDCFSMVPSEQGISDVDVYFYDADHEAESQYKALTHFLPVLKDVFVFIVDDWSWTKAKDGTRLAIEKLGLEIVFQKEINTDTKENRDGWWEGCCVFVLKKS